MNATLLYLSFEVCYALQCALQKIYYKEIGNTINSIYHTLYYPSSQIGGDKEYDNINISYTSFFEPSSQI